VPKLNSIINEDEEFELQLDPAEFDASIQMARILGISVDFQIKGNYQPAPRHDELVFQIRHSGLSLILVDGNVYKFNHQNFYQWFWRWNFYGEQRPIPDGPSPIEDSLLQFLLCGLKDGCNLDPSKIVKFEPPALWASIFFSLKDQNALLRPPQLASLTLTLNITKVPISPSQCTMILKVVGDSETGAFIYFSDTDLNSQTHSYGNTTRYYPCKKSVYLTASLFSGQSEFLGWCIGGKTSIFQPNVTVVMKPLTFVVAVYKSLDNVTDTSVSKYCAQVMDERHNQIQRYSRPIQIN